MKIVTVEVVKQCTSFVDIPVDGECSDKDAINYAICMALSDDKMLDNHYGGEHGDWKLDLENVKDWRVTNEKIIG